MGWLVTERRNAKMFLVMGMDIFDVATLPWQTFTRVQEKFYVI
jgi:hypothetical protein